MASSQLSAQSDSRDLINWVSYDTALVRAKKENKHILVNFTTSWCGWCKRMKATTYSHPYIVKTIKDSFVAAKVDGDSYRVLKLNDGDITEKGLTSQYGVSGYPTTWFLEPDGKRLAPVNGYIDSIQMTFILDYVSQNINEEMSFAEFAKQQTDLGIAKPAAKIKLGMPSAQVKSVWGPPEKIEKKSGATAPSEEWLYTPNHVLTFKNGKLSGYQQRQAAAESTTEKKSNP